MVQVGLVNGGSRTRSQEEDRRGDGKCGERGTSGVMEKWDMKMEIDIPPLSIPATAASEMVRSTDFRPSLTLSVADF